jgi:NAD(P)-dependent dehydrogenase (short-subunit alcohol dehydrogenase family)
MGDRQVHQGDGEIIPLELDVTDKESIKKAVEFIKSRESKLDLLINNAGLASNKTDVSKGDTDVEGFSKDLFEDPMSNWEDTYRTNVFALYYTSVAFVPLLVKGNKEDKMHKVAKDFSPSIVSVYFTLLLHKLA